MVDGKRPTADELQYELDAVKAPVSTELDAESIQLADRQRDLARREARLAAMTSAREEMEDRNRPGLAVALSHVRHRLEKWRYGWEKKRYEKRWGKAGE